MPSRRHLLGLAASAVAAAAGCTANPPEDNTPTPNSPTLAAGEQVRGNAPPLTVEHTVTDPDYEYVPSNDTVRFPRTRDRDSIESYGYVPFEDWAYFQAATVAARAVRQQLETLLDDMDFIGASIHRTAEETLDIVVTYETELDQSGAVVGEPAVSVSRVIEETPRSVTATINFAGKTATHEFPVFVAKAFVGLLAD